jgi:hypothetical protein
MLLKYGLFPFLIAVWFSTGPLAERMSDWTALMVGTVTCLAYVGLGSSAKYHYRMMFWPAVFRFFLVHMPFVLTGVPVFGVIAERWSHLVGDLLALLMPGREVSIWVLFLTVLGLFLTGRAVHVVENRSDLPERLPAREYEGGGQGFQS